MGTQAKVALSNSKLGTMRQLTAHEPRPWNVPESIREHFRKVRSGLNLSDHPGSLCVAVCSTCRGEGVSWVTAMLSCAIAEENEPVFLIDYDRLHPSQNRIFGVEQEAGVAITLLDPNNLMSPRTAGYDICILTPEAQPSKSLEFGSSLRAALPKLRQRNKAILIDCEPMRDSSQLLDLAPALDGVLFVVEAERERREVVARNLESVKRAGLRVFGIILNNRKRYIPGWLYRAL
jgi:Mrp family chromosome partitioning ATPase